MRAIATTLACLGATLAFASAAQAGLIGSGAGFEIPDNTPGVGAETSFNATDTTVISDLTVNLQSLTHTWAGDLQMTLTHDAGGGDVLSATFVNRPGHVDTDGGTSFGVDIDYAGDYSFNDGGADLLTAFAGTGGAALATGTYSHSALVGGTTSLSVFNGRVAEGTWTLNITDNAGGDFGSLGGWSVDVTGVPAPGALALLGLAGLAGRARRRR